MERSTVECQELRAEILNNYRPFTNPNGLHVLSGFVRKPFIVRSPDAEVTAHPWNIAELFTYYTDRRIEFCTGEAFGCTSGGVPHQHAVNRLVARKGVG